MAKLTLIISILLSCQLLYAQFGFEYAPDITVTRGSDTLTNPWAGGLNYGQISDFDYDFDGDADLFIFDRSSNNVIVLTQETGPGGPKYKFQYDASENFPEDLRYRAAIVDYDNDGRKDLFTYGIGGVKVYRNIGDAVNGLQWEVASELLYSQYPGSYSNLYISSSDIPAYIDVDFDGDIDILTFDIGGRHVEYHQNQSIDLYGVPDSLIFELKNECWGKFSEDLNTNSVILNDPNSPCVGGNIPNPQKDQKPEQSVGIFKHSGSTLLALDYDNSGVLDLIIGDVSFSNLNLLINGGAAPNTNSAMISVDTSFPSNTTPVDIELFPASFFVDVDFDNIKDLLVCPNAKNISENETSVRFYKNTGSNSNPNFVYQSANFFQKNMIEHGSGTIPVLFDFNEDGLKDLMVANFFRFIPGLNKESTIAYYRNEGTASNPVYRYIDYDVFNLGGQGLGLRTVPTFGDVDDDGDEDMFMGLENGTLIYFENLSSGSGSVFGAGIPNYQDAASNVINTSGFCFPQLFDLDNDGLLDLILGKRDGGIMYYRNTGTSSVPEFTLTNGQLGMVDVSTITPDGYAAPHFFRLNDTTHLFTGTDEGKLWYFTDIDQHISTGDTFHLISDTYLNINTGKFSSFYIDDIDSDGNLNLFAGHDLGGLYHFEADPNSTVAVKESSALGQVELFPNPTGNYIYVRLTQQQSGRYFLLDTKGKLIQEGDLDEGMSQVDLHSCASGFYIMRIHSKDGTIFMQKILKQN